MTREEYFIGQINVLHHMISYLLDIVAETATPSQLNSIRQIHLQSDELFKKLDTEYKQIIALAS